MPRPKQRTADLRDQVLQAAMGLIEDEGVEGFTTRRVAEQSSTSTPAVYELFGDKAGLVREVFFEGFRRLAADLEGFEPGEDPRADLVDLLQGFRRFYRRNPVLAQVMFSRPFPDFAPGKVEAAAGRAVRERFVGLVQRAIDARLIAGDATDVAHVLLATAQGVAAVEVAGWLGTSRASVDRRWALAIEAVLDGLRPASM